MAYIHGDGYPGAEKQRSAAVLVKAQLSGLERALSGLTPREQAGFMSGYIDGLIQMGEAIRARNGDRSETPGFVQKSARKTPASAGRTARPARKDRVAKVAKKGKKKNRIRCPGCNARLRSAAEACRSCGSTTAAEATAAATKAFASVLAKAAPQFVSCFNGHANRPGGVLCSTCRSVMPGQLVPDIQALKSSGAAQVTWAHLKYASDPADRQLWWENTYGTAERQAS